MTLTRPYENQIVLYSTEEYIKEDIGNIMKNLRQYVNAEARVNDDHVQIICDLGKKKFEGRALRKLIVKEIKRVLREVLDIHWHQRLNEQAAKDAQGRKRLKLRGMIVSLFFFCQQ